MLIPKRQAYLKHDLYKIVVPEEVQNKAFSESEISEALKQVNTVKMASKGLRFVYCETDRRDGAKGWYADDQGFSGFGKMSESWGLENLTQPELYERKSWDNFKYVF